MLPPTPGLRRIPVLIALLVSAANQALGTDVAATVWKLDDPTLVGGHVTEVIGAPHVVDDAAIFDGAHDGIFVPVDPLDGAKVFTIEILFSPAGDGPEAQRFVHLQDTTPAQWRVMIEIRVKGKTWWLDTYLGSPKGGSTQIEPKNTHPTDEWYWAAVTFDGSTMTHFVNGVKEFETKDVTFGPLGPGKTSLGVRQNRVYWFKGAIKEVRFAPEALPATKLQKMP